MAEENSNSNKEILYEPRELYEKQLKKQFHQNADDYFEELIKKGNVDVEANKLHVKQYKQALEEAKKHEKSKSGKVALKVFLIILSVILYVVGVGFVIAGIYNWAQNGWLYILIAVACVALGVVLDVYVVKKLNPEIKSFQDAENQANAKAAEALRKCWADLATLNSLYDWNIPCVIMEKTTPIIDLDPTFSNERLQFLRTKFGALNENNPEESTLGILSGHIQGNPFVLQKVLGHQMGEKTYTGSLVIHWTTTVRTQNGTRVEHHTQTLTASYRAPCPFYGKETRLIYGNEAAPDLHFSRVPFGADNMDEKQREKAVKSASKEMQKLHEKTLGGKGGGFNPMANEEFETFFHAWDRDNEIQFRLLFTPLAQKNEIDILTNKEPFGDDFAMVKHGMVTSVASRHSQNFDYSGNPARFVGYDIESVKQVFLDYCDEFIKGLYFDLAPLISIPLYQMHKPHEFIYQDVLPSHVSTFEHEVLANSISADSFRPLEASPDVPLILKSTSVKQKGGSDIVNIHAFSYTKVPMCEMIPVVGGDGHTHLVPVHWYRYDRVDSDTNMAAKEVGGSKTQYDSSLSDGYLAKYLGDNKKAGTFQRGLFAAALVGGLVYTETEEGELNTVFSSEKKQ